MSLNCIVNNNGKASDARMLERIINVKHVPQRSTSCTHLQNLAIMGSAQNYTCAPNLFNAVKVAYKIIIF
jgi:hypothetical protein